MISVITGDIVNSRKLKDQQKWMLPLKELFNEMGIDKGAWDIYRGDSFQVKVPAEDSLRIALLIKALILKIEEIQLDVRLAIGLGTSDTAGLSINESTGQAYIYSGTLLDKMSRSDVKLGLKTPWPEIDKHFDMMFRLALVILNGWTQKTAEVAFILLKEQKKGITQQEIANKLGVVQSTVNAHIKRGSLYEILELETYYSEIITQKINERRD